MGIPVSVVIISRNNDDHIASCLESVCNWADEIIVIDDESTDKSREIAARFTSKVLTHKFINEGKDLNWSISQAASTWVLSLAANEVMTPQLKTEIRQALDQNPRVAGFSIPRKNFLGNYWLQSGGKYPDPKIKLFLKEKFKWEEVDIHPRPFLDGICGPLKNPLYHYSYNDYNDFLDKINRQTNMEAQKWLAAYKEAPKRVDCQMNKLGAITRANAKLYGSYLVQMGWQDGLPGLVSSVFDAVYEIVAYAKFTELKQKYLQTISRPPKAR